MIEAVTGERVVLRDDGSEDSSYDFTAGQQFAIEVTRLTVQTSERDAAALAPYIGPHAVTGLGRSWGVMLSANVRAKTKRRTIVDRILPAIRALDSMGIADVAAAPCWGFPPWMHSEEDCPVLVLRREGVRCANQMPTDPEGPRLWLATVKELEERPRDLVEAIEAEFTDPVKQGDLASKLNKADRPERHVFFWAQHSRYRAFRALYRDELPDRSPEVPQGVTGVWAALLTRPDRGFLWQLGTGWRRVSVPEGQDVYAANA